MYSIIKSYSEKIFSERYKTVVCTFGKFLNGTEKSKFVFIRGAAVRAESFTVSTFVTEAVYMDYLRSHSLRMYNNIRSVRTYVYAVFTYDIA